MQESKRRHHVIGAVHLIRPSGTQVSESLRHESQVCGAARIVLDLRESGDAAAVEAVAAAWRPEHRDRLQIVLPPDTDPAEARRLESYSFSVTLASDDRP